MIKEKEGKGMSSLGVALLWAGVAVSVSEMWAGSLLNEAGLVTGLILIVAGHILGGLVLSLGGRIGTRYRVMAMQSTRLVLGNRGSVLPSFLNVLQLVGWATIMLALSGDIGARVGENLGGIFASRAFWIIVIGAGTLAWSFLVGSTKLQWIHTVVILGLLGLSIVMTYLSLNPKHYTLRQPYYVPISFSRGMRLMDLVIVMPISWVPLMADYSRLAKSEKGAFWGSLLGYGIVSTWMYVIGLIVSLATGTDDPAMNILMMMGRLGLTIPAILLVFSSTMTSDFPDIYSSACSLFNIHPKIKPVYTMWGTGILTTLLALFFDLSRFEDFLGAVGAVFVPLFSILLVDYFLIRKQDLKGIDFETGKGLEFTKGYRIPGLVIWGTGIAVYFIAQGFNFFLGGSISSFFITAILYIIMVRKR